EAIIHAPPSAALWAEISRQSSTSKMSSAESHLQPHNRRTARVLLGLVMRCWHDVEEIPPATAQSDPLMRPLSQGEVGA
ncbi:unnamed protein product, partial [Mycena citricolor]